MKTIGIPHHDCSPNYFRNELCWSVAIFANLQIVHYSEWSTNSCVDEPTITIFTLCWALTISLVWDGFPSFEGGLDCLIQIFEPHYSLQSKHDLTVSSHVFPTPSQNLFKLFQSFRTFPIHGISSKYGGPREHLMGSCRTLCEHPPCTHNLHTFQPSYFAQRHLNPIHIEWSAHEYICPLQV